MSHLIVSFLMTKDIIIIIITVTRKAQSHWTGRHKTSQRNRNSRKKSVKAKNTKVEKITNTKNTTSIIRHRPPGNRRPKTFESLKNYIELIKFLWRHTVVTSEALGTRVWTTRPESLPDNAATESRTLDVLIATVSLTSAWTCFGIFFYI